MKSRLTTALLMLPMLAMAQGAQLIDGFGGPGGYGEPFINDPRMPVEFEAAFPDGLRLYDRALETLHVNWEGSISGDSTFSSYWGLPFPQRLDLNPDPLPPRIAVWEAYFYANDYDPLAGESPLFVAVEPPTDAAFGRIVATWLDIPDRPIRRPETRYNSYQTVLTNTGDGDGDYTIELRYHRCEWTLEHLQEAGWPIIGFEGAEGVDGPGWTWPGSLSDDALLLCDLSNVREPGVWRYTVRDGVPTGCGPDPAPPPGPGRCADGNHLPGDGCSPACYVEPDTDRDGRFEPPHPDSPDPLGVYDRCTDLADPDCDDDADDDMVPDQIDNCVDMPNPEQHDHDADRVGDACDPDADGDGLDSPLVDDSLFDVLDTCPLVRSTGTRQLDPELPALAQPTDTDRDGLGDPCDPDDDDDGISDCGADGICDPLDNGYNDDEDRHTDEADECLDDPDCARGDRDFYDNDGDGFVDERSERPLEPVVWPGPDAGEDNCRAIYNPEQDDLDGDGIGDACDHDTDGDGVDDCLGGWCGYAGDFRDNDNDGRVDEIGECAAGCDPLADRADQDLDGFVDEDREAAVEGWPPPRLDVCPTYPDPEQRDADGDGIGDPCDDNDRDGVIGHLDNCPDAANPQQPDLDADGLGDVCDPDDDGDGVSDTDDVCPRLADPAQTDNDRDGLGDACDPDDDDDRIPDSADGCPLTYDPDQADLDGDGIGDACDDDIDGDGTDDTDDRCPRVADDQRDLDGDGLGDACDADDDGDGIPDVDDRCPAEPDDQADLDDDGTGDACDETDDRPFAVRTPAEQCQILLEQGAPTRERLRICPAPKREVGCGVTPGGAPAAPLVLALLSLWGLRRPRAGR